MVEILSGLSLSYLGFAAIKMYSWYSRHIFLMDLMSNLFLINFFVTLRICYNDKSVIKWEYSSFVTITELIKINTVHF